MGMDDGTKLHYLFLGALYGALDTQGLQQAAAFLPEINGLSHTDQNNDPLQCVEHGDWKPVLGLCKSLDVLVGQGENPLVAYARFLVYQAERDALALFGSQLAATAKLSGLHDNGLEVAADFMETFAARLRTVSAMRKKAVESVDAT